MLYFFILLLPQSLYQPCVGKIRRVVYIGMLAQRLDDEGRGGSARRCPVILDHKNGGRPGVGPQTGLPRIAGKWAKPRTECSQRARFLSALP